MPLPDWMLTVSLAMHGSAEAASANSSSWIGGRGARHGICAATKAERERTGDPRPSLEERYPIKDLHVAAAEMLVTDRLLLPEDAARLIAEANAKGVRTGP